jgi:hypothetical protein
MEQPPPIPERYDATEPMGVENIGFMLERLGRDCDDLQFLRELTMNSLEAGATQIIWDYDRAMYDMLGVYKLCCIDDGHGMTGEEMRRYINQLSASRHEQAFDGNFGVGAKIAAATRNPAGLIYQSWKDGRGAMIQLWRDEVTRQYGLRQFELPDGSFRYVVPIGLEGKPSEISDHGTKVILLGKSEEHDTIEPPPGVATPSRWVNRYLNARFLRFPDGVEVKAREGWTGDPVTDKKNLKRRVRGQGEFLDDVAQSSGIEELSEAFVHWWILDESEQRRNASELVNVGHFASLYQNELYELRTGRSGVTRLHQFGVIFGYDRVVLYVEPKQVRGRPLSANTARTQLLREGQPLPYADWAVEFRAQMPQAIQEYMDAVIAGSQASDHHEAIAERLRHYQKLFRLSRYRLRQDGRVRIQEPVIERPKPSRTTRENGEGARSRPRQEMTGRLLAAMLAEHGQDGEEVNTNKQDLPKVVWVSEVVGTRAPDFLADRAAKYLAEDNLIQANADFRVFTDMAEFWAEQYDLEPDNVHVTSVVHEWFEQALVETVIGCQALQGEREWSPGDIERALSEEALTATVMQRYHVANSVKRTLGARLGSLRDREGAAS